MFNFTSIMTYFYTRLRLYNYTKAECYVFTKKEEKIVKLCLHPSYTMQNSFHFDDIFFKVDLFFQAKNLTNKSKQFALKKNKKEPKNY